MNYLTFKDLKVGDLFTYYRLSKKNNSIFLKSYIDDYEEKDKIQRLNFDPLNEYDVIQNVILCVKNDTKNKMIFMLFESKITKITYTSEFMWVAPVLLVRLE